MQFVCSGLRARCFDVLYGVTIPRYVCQNVCTSKEGYVYRAHVGKLKFDVFGGKDMSARVDAVQINEVGLWETNGDLFCLGHALFKYIADRGGAPIHVCHRASETITFRKTSPQRSTY